MAMLRNLRTGRHIMLRPLHTFGRHPTACQTVLQCPVVSHIHALARWTPQRWEVFDQSRNGTYVDGQRLPAGKWHVLELGSRLALGNSPEAQWSVENLAPPVDCMLPLRGPVDTVALHPQGAFLPCEAQPEVYICCREGRWMLEDEHGITVLEDGVSVHTSAMDWEVVLCPDLARTQDPYHRPIALQDAEVLLHFELSQDEEHACLRLEAGGQMHDLGERIHHYLLATLARRRQADAQRGLASGSQGWVATEELARMLGADPSHVNIQIFRARHQLAGAWPAGMRVPLVVERRRGEVRMGDCSFTVRRGGKLEGGLSRHRASAYRDGRDPRGTMGPGAGVMVRHGITGQRPP